MSWVPLGRVLLGIQEVQPWSALPLPGYPLPHSTPTSYPWLPSPHNRQPPASQDLAMKTFHWKALNKWMKIDKFLMKEEYFSEKDNFGWCGGKGGKGRTDFLQKSRFRLRGRTRTGKVCSLKTKGWEGEKQTRTNCSNGGRGWQGWQVWKEN